MFFSLLGFPFVMLFTFIMFLGTFLCLSSAHWFGAWVGLEVNLMGFIPIMVQNKGVEEAESAMKYFLIQALGSGMLLFGLFLMFWSFGSWEFSFSGSFSESSVVLLGLLLKLGAAPLHFWMPSVVAGLSWYSVGLLLIWQKIAPLFLLSYFAILSKEWMVLIIVLSSIFGGIGGVNQTSLRGLLAYSSILHLGWILAGMKIAVIYCFFYFILYSIILMLILSSFMWKSTWNNKQFSNFFSWSYFDRLYLVFMFLSMGGMPPLLGFFGKWAVLLALISLKDFMISGVLVSGSILSLYYYLTLSFSLLMGKSELKLSSSFSGSKLVMSGMLVNLLGMGMLYWFSIFL